MGLNEHNVTMKISNKRVNSIRHLSIKNRLQSSLKWIMLKKTRPTKHKYIALPPRKKLM